MTQYSGKIIRKNPVVPTQTSASGVWTTAQAAAAVKSNTWPVAGVPDPISRSLRFRSSASAYLNRTNGTPTSTTTTTISFWIKRGTLGVQNNTLGAGQASGTNYSQILFNSADQLNIGESSGTGFSFITTQVFRDPSAWYHIVFVYDSTQATSTNRLKLYVNGVQVTSFSTAVYPALNQAYLYNTSAYIKAIGNIWYNGGPGGFPFDGYLTEINFIDGQALTPSSFGTTDSTTGAWIPMPYTGTYGTNGFYLNFKDNSSTGALGLDYSGNGNTWTTNNISLTAGTTYDSMVDVPTLWGPYNTSGDTGALFRGNYAVWNPLGGSGVAVTDGNLKSANSAASYLGCFGSIALPSSGKFYFEAQLTANSGGSNIANFGIAPTNTALSGNQVGATNSASMYCGATILINGSNSVRGSAGLTTDVFQVCYDASNGNVYLGINNTFYQSNGTSGGDPANGTNPSRTLTAGELAPWMFGYQIGWTINFGQRPFTYTPPSGFVALNTQNLPNPTISNGANYMAATLYTGNSSTQNIANTVNGVSFQPDFVWVKSRSLGTTNESYHFLVDSVRGLYSGAVYNYLNSNTTASENNSGANVPTSYGGVNTLNSNGFGVTGAGSGTYTNQNAATYVAWQWQAGKGTSSSNTSGSITSTVSVGATQGFSVVAFSASPSQTVGHGLGVAPKMMIVKSRTSAAVNWYVYHASTGATGYTLLNTTAAFVVASNVWDNTAPTSTVFTVGSGFVNATWGNVIAYCFSEVAGFSKFGSYTGNGSADGPFVYCGFRPRFVMVKRTDAVGGWVILDTSRDTYNVASAELAANTSTAEVSPFSQKDFLSNGFKLRNTQSDNNASAGTYIFAAFAETPFKNSNAR